MESANIRIAGVLFLLAVGSFFTFLLYNGLIDIHQDAYSCLGNRRWYEVGDRHRIIAVGNLNVYYRTFDFGCPDDRKYDSSKYHVVLGQLEPN